MQFLAYDPTTRPEDLAPPTPELMEKMDKFIAEGFQAGVLVTTGALSGPATRLNMQGGDFSVTDGPHIEVKELMGGFAILQVDSLEEAIEWLKRFRRLVGDGTTEIVQLYGPQ